MINNSQLPARLMAGADTPRGQFLWLAACLFAGLGLTGVLLYGSSIGTGISMALFVVIALIASLGLSDFPLDTLGGANVVTTIRACMIAFLAGSIVQPDMLNTHGWLLFAIAVFAFVMDGIDGFLARRDGAATAYGARYDMEMDALFGAVLSLVILSAGFAGPFILILGFMRYGFVAISYLLPWLNGPLPESLRRKSICVIQIAALVALICPIVPQNLHLPITLFGAAMLIWSFVVDALWLKRSAS